MDSCHKDLYPLDGFKSCYSDKLPNKANGTGVDLYIHESFDALTYEEVTTTSLHLETLFVKITKGNQTIYAGVVYRLPISCFQEFLLEFEKIIKALPKNTITYIIGDFNLNLLNSATNSEVEAFETLFLSKGLYPVISLITHQRKSKNCSCIDNIFTNMIENIAHSGVIADQGTAHSPIISLTNLYFGAIPQTRKKQTQ